jgi:uncharacterized protein
LSDATVFETAFRPDLLGGVVALTGRATESPAGVDWAGRLYRSAAPDDAGRADAPVEVTAIPYYAWANREPGRMRVWLRRES